MTRHVLVNLVSQPPSHPTGIMRGCFGLLEALSRRPTFRYTFRSTLTAAQLPPFFTQRGIATLTVPQPRYHFVSALAQAGGIGRLARHLGVDAVLNVDNVCALFGGPPSAVIAHDLYVHTLPDAFSDYRRLKDTLLWRFVARSTGAILANSQSTADDLARFVPSTAGKLAVVHHDAPPLPAVDATAPPLVAGRYVLVVGAASANKNLPAIAAAMKRVVAAAPDVRLVHVGHDPEGQIAAAAGPAVQVVRLTGVDDLAIANLYRHAVCLLNASLVEGFCLPIVEAQRCGCPVVCSDRSAAAEVAGDGALRSDPTDIAELVRLVRVLLSDRHAAEALRQRGYVNAERFSWDRSAARVEYILTALVDGSKPR